MSRKSFRRRRRLGRGRRGFKRIRRYHMSRGGIRI